jgi:DnaJ-class molecular chaperone
MNESHLSFLGLKRPFTQQQLKDKYREFVKKNHPDVGGNNAIFLQGKEAYETLSNELNGGKVKQKNTSRKRPQTMKEIFEEMFRNNIKYDPFSYKANWASDFYDQYVEDNEIKKGKSKASNYPPNINDPFSYKANWANWYSDFAVEDNEIKKGKSKASNYPPDIDREKQTIEGFYFTSLGNGKPRKTKYPESLCRTCNGKGYTRQLVKIYIPKKQEVIFSQKDIPPRPNLDYEIAVENVTSICVACNGLGET